MALCLAFKASIGISPYQWQLNERIKTAQGILVSSDAPLDVVAEATGSSNSMHVIRTFKKAVPAYSGGLAARQQISLFARRLD